MEIAAAHTRTGGVRLHQRRVVGRAKANLFPHRNTSAWNKLPVHLLNISTLKAFKSAWFIICLFLAFAILWTYLNFIILYLYTMFLYFYVFACREIYWHSFKEFHLPFLKWIKDFNNNDNKNNNNNNLL